MAFLGGTTLLPVPALMDHVFWQGGAGDMRWLSCGRGWSRCCYLFSSGAVDLA
jgi:hypothetical protein